MGCVDRSWLVLASLMIVGLLVFVVLPVVLAGRYDAELQAIDRFECVEEAW